jgi:hypothetical protein
MNRTAPLDHEASSINVSRRGSVAARLAGALGRTGLCAFLGAGALFATQGGTAPGTAAERLEQRILALERTILEMERRHAEEMAALKKEIVELKEGGPGPAAAEEDELAALRRIAEEEARREEAPAAAGEDQVFKARGLSLQALNPEISVTGDMYAFYRDQEGERERSGFEFRGLGIHLESYLDPYSRFKAAVPVNENGASLGEAYMTRYGLPGGLSATFGKFRQQFGVINRWHKHALDQFDFPLALRQVFGDGGLNQTGVSLDWVLPQVGKTSQDLTFQLTDGSNSRLFSGNTLGTPSLLLHYKNYRDLSKDTYFEWGLTGLVGWKDEWDVLEAGETVTLHDSLPAAVYGMDFDLLWEPTDRMRYRNLEWRTELYVLDRRILAPDGSGEDTVNAWGAYTYLQSKVNRKLDVGVRVDYFRPDSKGYAALDSWLAPHAFPEQVEQWQIGPYVTWVQSPWVRWRIEYNHLEPGDLFEPEDIIYFQLVFAAGPHKHERY